MTLKTMPFDATDARRKGMSQMALDPRITS